MAPYPFILVTPATRGLSLALTRHYLRTTDLPVFATYRSGSAEEASTRILSTLHVDKDRLKTLKLNLLEESSISDAADELGRAVPRGAEPYLHTAFFTGGILYPERKAAALDLAQIRETFQVNAISHMLCIKYFSRFLPHARTVPKGHLSKWVHVSARVGSVSDNKLGGWYSYRSSKAALNQVVKTFDRELQHKKTAGLAIAVHPGTVQTDLSKEFWENVPANKLFTPEYAAEQLAEVVAGLTAKDRGKVWDWKGEEIIP
ncbi:unnamed protein product [Peniophora sp. CBMAI 1063]|nr:unnamed protein product [Peniophora sp. CBMAI 1063]